jgi:large subunit ribosomal protein L15
MASDKRIGLENLRPPAGSKRSRKRVGRGHGSGSGKTSGRGHKGQKSRSGASIPAWFEGGQMPLYRRTPKRGFTSFNREEYQVVNIRDLDRVSGDSVGLAELKRAGLMGSMRRPVKLLGEGDVARSLTVTVHACSRTARAKIEAAGGRVELISRDG